MFSREDVVELSAADDKFHAPVGTDPSWTETSYWSFDLAERNMSLAVYPLFRPNLGVCSLAVHLWDHTASVPWLIPYSRHLWHIPMPGGDLTELSFEGLTFKTLEPLSRYFVGYSDADRISFELEYTAHRRPFGSTTQVPQPFVEGTGHYDQSLDVVGELVLAGERIPIDTVGHRDRSWYNRPDNRSRTSVSLCFGSKTPADAFMVMTPLNLLGKDLAVSKPRGMLLRDGVEASLESCTRRVTERRDGMPVRMELELTDTLDRTIRGEGRARNNLAFQTSPPVIAWFSFFEWDAEDGVYRGEDQEAHSAHALRSTYR